MRNVKLDTVKRLLPRNEKGFLEIGRVLRYAGKDFSAYLKNTRNTECIISVTTQLGIEILPDIKYLTVGFLKESKLIISNENPKTIYLHPKLIDNFLGWCWCYIDTSPGLTAYLQTYIPPKRKKPRLLKKRRDYTREEVNEMVQERLRGNSYQTIASKFFCHPDTARNKVMSAARDANITIPRRTKKDN